MYGIVDELCAAVQAVAVHAVLVYVVHILLLSVETLKGKGNWEREKEIQQ